MDFTVRVGEEEISRILNLRENLDHRELLASHAALYQRLGWSLAAVSGPGEELDLDFSQPPKVWTKKLADLGVANGQVNVGIRTGRASQLLVLEVNRGEGALPLEELGEWRAECIAGVGECREQHYYALPPGGPFPGSFFLAPQVMVYGEGGLVLAPPSLEFQSNEPWRWLKSPWEHSPGPPGPAVWQFLQEHLPGAGVPATWEEASLPAWEEVYRLVSSSDAVLKALLAPADSVETYYQELLQAALAAGLADPGLLLGLLWHAPRGDARQCPERWQYLQELVGRAAPKLGVPARPPGFQVGGVAASLGLSCAWPANTREPESPVRFDQSLAGQFFQLLAGLGERVITETARCEALRLESAVSPGARTVAWDRRFVPLGNGADSLAAGLGDNPLGLWEEEHQSRLRYFQEVQAATNEFLSNYPDLAGDPSKVQMVLLCLKNYVNLDPAFAELPVKIKMERAAQMAREFLEEMD